MTLMIEPAKALFALEGRAYDLNELEAFVQEGREYLEKHPALRGS
jgi:hypothetical protein